MLGVDAVILVKLEKVSSIEMMTIIFIKSPM